MSNTFENEAPERPSLPSGQKVVVKVNGEVVGEAEQSDLLGTVAKRAASNAGIRSFAVKITAASGAEHKADQNEAGNQLSNVASLDVIAKDTRGLDEALRASCGQVVHCKMRLVWA